MNDNERNVAAGSGENVESLSELRRIRREKLTTLVSEGRDPFKITKYDVTHHAEEIKGRYDELEGQTVSVAGRLMSTRIMVKASFCHILDRSGEIQAYVARDSVGEGPYADFKKTDIGDLVGLRGVVFRTKTGETSIHAEEIVLLSKSLQILPEKYHGLTNTDLRYRQRYVDLIMNPEVRDTFVKRSKIIASIRRFLDKKDFIEVETPMLVANAGGAAARPFETHFNALDEDFKLRISLELYLKRLIVGGLERVYEIGRVFRNEGLDTRHNPEFTLMELYQAYTDYHGMMDLTEEMFRHVAKEVLGTTTIVYNGIEMDLGKPFERITMIDAVKKYSGVDFSEIKTLEQARAAADEHGVHYEERHKKGDILNLFFEEFAESHLIQPTFVMDHPVEISPLTKKKPEDPDFHPKAPGMKYKHYAPKAPMIIFEGDEEKVLEAIEREKNQHEMEGENVVVLEFGENGAIGAAHELFAKLREADREHADIILAAALPQKGVGFSVMNRMLKSAGFNIRKV